MAEIRAAQNGLWSSTSTWTGGALPTASDDVYANNFNVYIDTSITVLSLNTRAGTTAVAGGRFYNLGNTTINSGLIFPGTTNCLTLTGSTTHAITATNIRGSNTTASVGGLYMAGSTIIGQPTVTLVGNVTGGSFTSQNWAIQLEGGSLTMTGSVYGGSGTSSDGIYVGTNTSFSTVLVLSSGPIVSGTGSASRGIFYNYSPTGTVLANSSCTLNCNISGNSTSTGTNFGSLHSNTSIPFIINGTVHGATGGSTTNYGIYYAGGTNTTTLNGNVNFPGAPCSTPAIYLNASGLTVNVIGNVFAPTGGGTTSITGITITQTTNTVNVTGTVVGGTGSNNNGYGIYQTTTAGILTVVGTVSGGSTNNSNYGVYNQTTGTIVISGTSVGGLAAAGAFNNSTGTIIVQRAKGNGWGAGSAGITGAAPGVTNNAQGSLCNVEELEFGPLGQSPIQGTGFKIINKSTNVCLIPISTSGTKTLVDASTTNVLPPVSSVRSGVSYGSSSVGTLAVPSASNVSFGVAVDNTTGTAVLTPDAVWQTNNNTLTASSLSGTIGYRLRNVATTEVVGQQIAAYNT